MRPSGSGLGAASQFYAADGWTGNHVGQCSYSAADRSLGQPQALGLTQVFLPPGGTDVSNLATCAEACCMSAGCTMCA